MTGMTDGVEKQGYFVGKVVKAVTARYETKMTEPPRRYTEDALIADMLSAHKFADTPQDQAILKETEGLGTSRTRAATIEGLIQGGFLISRKKRKLFEITSSDVARMTLANLPPVLTGVATTAKWEVAFKMIEKGQATPAQVRQALKNNLDFIVKTAKDTGRINLPGVERKDSVKASPAGQPASTRFSSMGAQPSAGAQKSFSGGASGVASAPSSAGNSKGASSAGAAGKSGSGWFR